MIRCIKEKFAHWGIIFEEEKYYNFEYLERQKPITFVRFRIK